MEARRLHGRRLEPRPSGLPELRGGDLGSDGRGRAAQPRRTFLATALIECATVRDIERELARLGVEAAEPGQSVLRTRVMTHMAWVPPAWEDAARGVLDNLGDRHPSRTIMFLPRSRRRPGRARRRGRSAVLRLRWTRAKRLLRGDHRLAARPLFPSPCERRPTSARLRSSRVPPLAGASAVRCARSSTGSSGSQIGSSSTRASGKTSRRATVRCRRSSTGSASRTSPGRGSSHGDARSPGSGQK